MHRDATASLLGSSGFRVGAVGEARVTRIEPCPPIVGDSSCPAGVVTGLFAHRSGNTADLRLTGLTAPIGTTLNHPFWSEDRGAFVPAGDLGVGERVRTLSGLARVVSLTPRGPPEAVYNLEVHGEHVYRVSHAGVLVHNNYVCDGFVELTVNGRVAPSRAVGHTANKAMTGDQRALKELVDEATLGGRKPLSVDDADIILDWAQEYNYPGVRASPGDVGVPSNWTANPQPHIHIPGAGRGGHVLIQPGVQPR